MSFDLSGSVEVIEIGTDRKPVSDFLLVFHCNYTRIFYRFRGNYLLLKNLRFLPFSPAESHLKPSQGVFSNNLRYEIWSQTTSLLAIRR